MRLTFETIAIGDEILTGKISDSNSTFVADNLFQRGFSLSRQTVVPDDLEAMTLAIEQSAARASLVFCFGGLGPTSDDKTAECVAKLLGCPLVEHAPSREKMEAMYRKRGREITRQALKQIVYPQKSDPLLNPGGMAPAFSCQINRARFIFLPGVPHEMKAILGIHLEPLIASVSDAPPEKVLSHTFRCLGIWESELQGRMDSVEAKLGSSAWLGYRTSYPENHLTLYVRETDGQSQKLFHDSLANIREILKPWTYTEGSKSLEHVVVETLVTKKIYSAFAESCTGGLATQRLTRIPGASQAVWGGFVSYDIRAKRAMLGVEVANADEAVSAECAREMAEHAKEVSRAGVAGAITGFLGPAGGTSENPVGTVYLCAIGSRIIEQRISLPVRERADLQWGASSYLLSAVLAAIS